VPVRNLARTNDRLPDGHRTVPQSGPTAHLEANWPDKERTMSETTTATIPPDFDGETEDDDPAEDER
jgi:hypothetical protein